MRPRCCRRSASGRERPARDRFPPAGAGAVRTDAGEQAVVVAGGGATSRSSRRRGRVRRVPILNQAIASVLQYAHRGSRPLVLATTLANGVGEEVFFRGAVYAAAGIKHPAATSTAVYTLAATATRNPGLVLASGVMGALFALQRRASGGIQAPVLTHLTWSTLVLR